MQGRRADAQELWCVIWLDSAVTVSCNLQLPASSKPASIPGRDVNGTDQRGVGSRGIGTLAPIMSNPLHVHFPSLLSSGSCLPSASQSFRDMKRAIQMSKRDVLMLHEFTFSLFFVCFLYSLSRCYFFFMIAKKHINYTPPPSAATRQHKQERLICGGAQLQ